MLYCSVNYQQVNTISTQDRGLAYGDGLFTTAKIKNGQIEMLNAHLQRLQTGCTTLGLISPDFSLLTQHICKLAIKYPLAVLKIMITAGAGGRGYSRQGVMHSNVIVMIFEFPQHYLNWQQQGINLGVARTQLGLNGILAGIKHLNRLEQVCIRQELDQREEDDLLVSDINKCVVESSCANIFWFKEGCWQTANIKQAGIAGLMRANIINTMDIMIVSDVNIMDLNTIEAAFICNSVMGIVPIKTYNKKTLSLTSSYFFIDDFFAKLNITKS